MAKQKLPTANADQFDGMTLMRVTESNIKRVRYVDISIDRDLTVIGGDNANGKTSLLDGIEWATGRKDVIQLDPIHHGKQEGRIALEFGDGEKVSLKVTKTIQRVGEKDWTADVMLEIPGYATPSRVQEFLSSLFGQFSFDPMAFDAMDDAAQFDALQKLVGNFDFKQNKADYDSVFKQRTDVNRDQRTAQAAADAIVISMTAPGEAIDEAALTAELRSAGEHNLDIERRRSNREQATAKLSELRSAAAAALARIETDVQAKIAECNAFCLDIEEQIRLLQQRIASRQEGLQAEIKGIRDSLTAEYERANAEAEQLEQRLNGAGPLPPVKDAQAIEAQLAAARHSNKLLSDWEAQRARKLAHEREATRLQTEADALTKQLDDLQQAKQAAILNAQLPIDGLGFGDDYITLYDSPWKQASEGERTDASTAIAMALNPKIKMILVRHSSGVGTRIRERIRQRAAGRGYRVIMEVFDETGANSHVFIEDGMVKKLDGPADKKADAA